MITAKTYPTPSTRHLETVCTAGVRLDTFAPEWVRLYPISYRRLDYDKQFRKYEIVDVPITPRGSSDIRPESHSPDLAKLRSIRQVPSRDGWRHRRDYLGDLLGGTTTCALIRANQDLPPHTLGPSLGLIRPREVQVTVKPGRPWTPEQQAKVTRAAAPTLFDENYVAHELEPQPYEMRIKYRCTDPACPGHNQSNIDWEVGAAARKWNYPKDELPDRLRETWQSLFDDDKDAYLYIGNQLLHPASFMVLGVWSSKRA